MDIEAQRAESGKRGLGYVLKNIFLKPSLSFKSFKHGHAILLGFILIFSINIISGIIQMDKAPDFSDLEDGKLTEEILEQYKEQGLSQEQIDEIEKSFDSPAYKNTINMMSQFSGAFMIIGSIIAAIGVSIGWLVKAGIITLIFNFMGAKPKFGQIMGVMGLAWIPFFFRDLIRGGMALITGEVFSAASNLSNGLNIFVLWNVILLIIGFSVCLKISKKKAGAVVIGYWIFNMLIYLGLDKIGDLLTMGIVG